MITLNSKQDCCGCNACQQICPVGCISMILDEEGFNYPVTDTEKCIDCGLCNKTCPVINQPENTPFEPKAYAATNTDQSVIDSSSSGGVFSAIAEEALKAGATIFGVRFNSPRRVCHDKASSIEDLEKFRGSKYIPSDTGTTFVEVRRLLREGKSVVYSATPCQIAGLRLFLKNIDTSNLTTIEVACHGVPSPAVWNQYLDSMESKLQAEVTSVRFRDKRFGWTSYGLVLNGRPANSEDTQELAFIPFAQNSYMQGFIKDLYLRPSCHRCPAKKGKSGADITLADFWGINRYYPDLYCDSGTSLVLANTAKGLQILSAASIKSHAVDADKAIAGNPAIVRSAPIPKERELFQKEFQQKGISCLEPILKKMRPNIFKRLFSKAKRGARRIIGKQLTSTIKRISRHKHPD